MVCDTVPASVPVPELKDIVTVTPAVGTLLSYLSRTCTVTGGDITASAVVFEGS